MRFILASFIAFAAFSLAAPTVWAQAGTCGGTIATGIDQQTCRPNFIQCPSTHRAVGAVQQLECPRNSGDFYNVERGTCQYDDFCANPSATISISANPNPVFRGDNTAIVWSTTNATSCTSPDFNTSNAASGSVNVAPLESRSYSITCRNAVGRETVGSVFVTVNPPPFAASCSPNKTSAVVGEQVTWSATAWNGTAPYTFRWAGQLLAGLTGPSRTVTYDTPGSKTASVEATDSATLGAGLSIAVTGNDMCSGPIVFNYMPGPTQRIEDGGTAEDMRRTTEWLARAPYNLQNPPHQFFQPSSYWYTELQSNPQNYCVSVRMGLRMTPMAPYWTWEASIHQGQGRRIPQASDHPPGYDPAYSVTAIGTVSAGSPRVTNAACSVPVNVTAPAAPTASLSANPIGIIQGQTSRLTWSSTNATSCTGTNFSTGGAPSGAIDVQPGSTTTYSVSCTGAGGTSPTQSVTVSVTPTLTASCSVAPPSINTGGTATWTASPSGGTGVYSYSWSGTDGLSGTTQQVARTYTSPGTKTGAVRVISGTQDITVNCANSLSVTDLPRPNLTATIGGPVTIVAGQAGTFTGTTVNNGQATANAGFRDLFIFYFSDMSSWATSQYTPASGAIAAGGSAGRSVTQAFAAPGTYYYRLCADWENGVAETNEGDNCSAMQTLIVRPADPTNLSAACAPSGTSVTLSWTAPPSGGPYNYYVRMQDSITGTVENRDGWPSTSITLPVIPNRAYGWWLHTNIGPADYDGNRYSPGVGGPSFTCSGLANLTAGSVSPTTAIAGQPTTLFATARNLPEATGTSGAFPILFQVRQNGTIQRAFESAYIGGLAPGASQQGGGDHTFPSAGTYEARACANMNASMIAIVTESNYGDNCGDWTTITVAPPPPTGSLSCTVSTTQPTPGTSVTYTVTPSNGATGPYVWNDTQGGSYGSGATISRLIPDAGPYTMFVSGQNVITQPVSCPSVSGVCPSPTASISANPTRVRAGQTSTITWGASGVDQSCTVTGPGVNQVIPGGSCVIPSGSATVTINSQSTYRIVCDGDSSHSSQVIVNVIPEFEEF